MKKVYSLSNEILALRTLCSKDNQAGEFLFSKLSKEHFFTEIGSQTFDRIQKKFRQSGELPDWRLVISDPSLDQSVRDYLENKKSTEPLSTKKTTISLLRRLDDFKKQRLLVKVGKIIEDSLRSDEGIDTDELIQQVQNSLSGASISNDLQLLRVGGKKSNMEKVLSKILNGKAISVIPTGFNGFDKINRGLPFKSVLLVGGPTGGGKSALVGQLTRNMACYGAKVGVWGLEMSPEQMFTRDISSTTKTKGTDFLDPLNRIKSSDKRKIIQTMKEWENKISRSNGEIIYLADSEDNPRSMDQILAASKPYAFDVLVIDYVGLLKQTHKDGWVSLGDALKSAKKWADANNAIVIVCAQVDNDMNVRYAKQMEEHAPIAWKWKWDAGAKLHGVTEIIQSKARYVSPINFYIKFDFSIMTVTDATQEEIEKSKTKTNEKSKERWSKEEDDEWEESSNEVEIRRKPGNNTKTKDI